MQLPQILEAAIIGLPDEVFEGIAVFSVVTEQKVPADNPFWAAA